MKEIFWRQALNSTILCCSNPRMGSCMHINTKEGVWASCKKLPLMFFKEIGFSLLRFQIFFFLKRIQDLCILCSLHIICIAVYTNCGHALQSTSTSWTLQKLCYVSDSNNIIHFACWSPNQCTALHVSASPDYLTFPFLSRLSTFWVCSISTSTLYTHGLGQEKKLGSCDANKMNKVPVPICPVNLWLSSHQAQNIQLNH